MSTQSSTTPEKAERAWCPKGLAAALEQALSRYPLLCSIVINVVLVLLVYTIFTPSFLTCDDAKMLARSAGVVGYPSSPLILFSNVILGRLLQALYGWSLSIPWYGLLQVAALYTAHVALLYVVLNNSRIRSVALLLYLLYFGHVGILLFLRLQFTLVATTACLAGLVLLFPRPTGRSESRWPSAATGTALLVFGYLCRDCSLYLSVLLAAPLVALSLLWSQKAERRRCCLRYAVALALGLTATSAIKSYNRASYHADHSVRTAHHTHALAGQLNNYDPASDMKQTELTDALGEAGLSPNDYWMLRGWFWIDKHIMSADNLSSLLARAPSRLTSRRIVRAMGHLSKSLLSLHVGLCLFIAFLGVLGANNLKAAGTATFVYLIFLCAVFVGLSAYLKPLPFRVYFGATVLLVLVPMVVAQPSPMPQTGVLKQRMLFLGIVLALAGFGATVPHLWRETQKSRSKHEELAQDYRKLAANPDILYVAVEPSLNQGAFLPFADVSVLKDVRNIYWLDSWQHFPDWVPRLRQFGVHDLSGQLLSENVRLVIRKNRADGTLAFIKAYLHEHHGIAADAHLETSLSRCGIYRLTTGVNSHENKTGRTHDGQRDHNSADSLSAFSLLHNRPFTPMIEKTVPRQGDS